MSTQERVRRILASTLGIQVPAEGDFSRDSEPRWDSLKHVAVIFALEDEFDIQFDEDQMAALTSLSAIVEAVDAA